MVHVFLLCREEARGREECSKEKFHSVEVIGRCCMENYVEARKFFLLK